MSNRRKAAAPEPHIVQAMKLADRYTRSLPWVRAERKGWQHQSTPGLYLADGQAWPDLMPFADVAQTYGQGSRNRCWANALALVAEDPTLTYCEGYATCAEQDPSPDSEGRAGLPVPHGWVLNDKNQVIDDTWCLTDSGDVSPEEGRAYFGVAIPADIYLRWVDLTRWPNVVTDRTESGKLALRHGLIDGMWLGLRYGIADAMRMTPEEARGALSQPQAPTPTLTPDAVKWASTVAMFEQVGPPGIQMGQSPSPDDGTPVVCAMWRDDQGLLRGVASYWAPADAWTSGLLTGSATIVVDPDWRGQRIATALATHMLDTFQALGYTSPDWHGLEYTPAGAAFIQALQARGVIAA